MHLKKIPRKDFESINREDFWYDHFEKSEELFYWRKKYDIHEWFHINTSIYEECSDEITKEKLGELIIWLTQKGLTEYAEKIKEIVNKIDFVNNVVFYDYCN